MMILRVIPKRFVLGVFSLIGFLSILSAQTFPGASSDIQKVKEKLAASSGIGVRALGLTEKEEIEVGRQAAASLIGYFGIAEDKEAIRYISLLGNAIARVSDRPALVYHFTILDTNMINAFATPGGYVLLTRGLLSLLSDEAELAGVLAHEVAHVARRHVVREIQKSFLAEKGISYATAKARNPEILQQTADVTVNILFQGLSRQSEEDADHRAVVYTQKLGYNPKGLIDALEQLDRSNIKREMLEMLFATHPSPQDRIEEISRFILTKGYADEGRRNRDRFVIVLRRR